MLGFGGQGAMAKNAAKTATDSATGYRMEGQNIGSMLIPELEREAFHPTGFSPTDTNAMLVAGQQGAGGANAGIAGEAGLRAARTRNTGSLSSVLDEAARDKTRALSENALNVQGENARLKESKRQEGLAGLTGIRGGDINADLAAQGLVPKDIAEWTASTKGAWDAGIGLIDALTGNKKPR